MAFDPKAYSITVQREVVDGDLYSVGTVIELPDVVVYEDDYNSAYTALLAVITDLKSAADEDGRVFPEPRQRTSEYSGRLTVRLPQHIHRKVAMQAEFEHISINLFVATALAECVGEKSSQKVVIFAISNSTASESTGGQNFPLLHLPELTLGIPYLTATPQSRILEHV